MMGIKTEISWCDSSVNPVVGCDGCELSGGHCYAESLVGRYAGRKGWPANFRKPEFVDAERRLRQAANWSDLTGKERPEKPWLDGRPRMIFVCDLADPFSESLPLDWLSPHVYDWRYTPHVWMLLTKRPRRMDQFVTEWQQKYSQRFPRNIWGGTSVTSQETAWRVVDLLKVPSLAVRFLSMEPLLGPVDLTIHDCLGSCECGHIRDAHDLSATHGGACRCPTRWNGGNFLLPESDRVPGSGFDGCTANCACQAYRPKLHWVIVGGESGSRARPLHPDWVRSIRDQCQAAGVPFMLKQWGEWTDYSHAGSSGWARESGTTGKLLDGPLAGKVFETRYPWRGADGMTYGSMGPCMVRVGKKASGRLLDGKTWDGMPEYKEPTP